MLLGSVFVIASAVFVTYRLPGSDKAPYHFGTASCERSSDRTGLTTESYGGMYFRLEDLVIV